jgi:serine phosphatase RsbU (regulator of sigma subunit)
MSLKTGLLVTFLAILALIGGSLYMVSLAVDNESDIARTEARRHQSFKLADELRQTSDDLTRMARLFVVTADERYKHYFDEILAIREGNAPRPLDYGNIYWDFVVATGKSPRRVGEPAALERLMRDARFTDDELALLKRAKQRSDALVAIEEEAMQAVLGRFRDARGRYTVERQPDMERARRLMHGPEYHAAKSEIMAPIDEFLRKVDARTGDEVVQLRRRGQRLNTVAITGLGTTVVLVLVSFILVARQPFPGHSPVPGLRVDAAGSGADRRGRRPGHLVWTAWPLFMAAVVASGSVLGAAWWMSQSFADQAHRRVRDDLERLHQSTAQAVVDWMSSLDRTARAAADSPAVRVVIGTGASGRAHPWPSAWTGRDLGASSGSSGSEHGNAGYCIADARSQVVASDDVLLLHEDLGRMLGRDLVSELRRSPDSSTIVFPDARADGPATGAALRRDIVVVAGVMGEGNQVLGLVALRVDPRGDFSRILQRGRLGESGETYAFDRSGRLISEHRFEEQLRRIGLIGGGRSPHPGVELRDPGVDLTSRGRAAAPREALPYTRMAQAALAGHGGTDLSAYRDYRGVRVIGAWTWNERFGFGVATEVAEGEAWSELRSYRRQTRIATGLALVLILGLTGLFVWNRIQMASATAELAAAYAVIRIHKDRMQQELDVGRDIQLSMIPLDFSTSPEHEDISLFARLQPAREVGGDFYDFHFVGEKRLFLCIGDVSDKGVPAALFMAVTKTLIRSRSTDDLSPGSILTHVNDELSRDNAQCMFVTLFVGVLDLRTGELVYSNAGHDPPYVLRQGGSVEALGDRHGPLAGAKRGTSYGESHEVLRPGDTLLAYTDGVTETMDARAELFSQRRLAGLLEAAPTASPRELVDRIVEAVNVFAEGGEQADDITLLAVQLRGGRGGDVTLGAQLRIGNGQRLTR